MIGMNDGVCERECMGRSSGDEHLALTRYQLWGAQLYEALEGWSPPVAEPTTYRA